MGLYWVVSIRCSNKKKSLEKSFCCPSSIVKVWFSSLIRKTLYPTSLIYLIRLSFYPYLVLMVASVTWQWDPHVRVGPTYPFPFFPLSHDASKPWSQILAPIAIEDDVAQILALAAACKAASGTAHRRLGVLSRCHFVPHP